MADEPKWTPELEKKFVEIMGKDKTVENFGKGKDEDPDWRSSPGAMEWLNENYKKKAGKRRKTRKNKKRSKKTKRRSGRK